MTPAPWVGRSREGQIVSKHSSCQGTEWKWWARRPGKDNPGRYPQAWGYGYGTRKFWGTWRRALSASVFEHRQCLFSTRTAYSNSKGLPRWLYCNLSPSQEQGVGRQTMSEAFASVNKGQAGMWHLKCSAGRKVRDLYFLLYGNAHSSFLI